MQHRGWFDHDRWHRRRDRRHGVPRDEAAAPLAALRDTVTEAALWAAGCLALASLMPPVLVAPLLYELLLLSAVFVSLAAVLRGDRLTLQAFNRQDVALLLLALALVAGLFVDPAALEALAESGGVGGTAPTGGG